MIIPNVLNRPLAGLPSFFYEPGIPMALSTTDYFQSWEPLPERGALAFPKLLGIRGDRFCQMRLEPRDSAQHAAFALRSAWALMASADRRWREKMNSSSLPEAPGVMLRYFEPSLGQASAAWRFDDGWKASRHLGRVEMDDRHGRVLGIRQGSVKDDLSIIAGWQIGYYAALIQQETRISPDGSMRVGYRFEFGEEFFDGLMIAVGLDPHTALERLVMRLGALVQTSGQYAPGSLGLLLFESHAKVSFPQGCGASVTLSGKRLVVALPQPQGTEDFPLHPLLLEKLWNPIYAQALASTFDMPWLA